MLVFHIDTEPAGWYVVGPATRSGPCLSMSLAIERAQGIVDALRMNGEEAVLAPGPPVAAARRLRGLYA